MAVVCRLATDGQHRHVDRRSRRGSGSPAPRSAAASSRRSRRRARSAPRRAVGDRGPADEHRHGAGGAADHDVAARRALEPERVHEHVEEAGADGQHGAQQVDGRPQQDEGQRPRASMANMSAARGVTPPVTSGRFWVRSITASMSRSTYMLMALAPPAASVPPSTVADHQPQRRQAPLGHDHRRHRRDQQQLDDPRLGEGDVGADLRRGVAERGSAGSPAPARSLGPGRGERANVAARLCARTHDTAAFRCARPLLVAWARVIPRVLAAMPLERPTPLPSPDARRLPAHHPGRAGVARRRSW